MHRSNINQMSFLNTWKELSYKPEQAISFYRGRKAEYEPANGYIYPPISSHSIAHIKLMADV